MLSDNFKKEINDFFENLSVSMLNENAKLIKYSRNNLNNNDFDIVGVDEAGKKILIDVQYSFNFSKYGDIRVDLMSAGEIKKDYSGLNILSINKMINEATDKYGKFQEIMSIKKKGKFFDDRLSGVFYFIYDEENKNKNLNDYMNSKISGVFFLPQIIIEREIKNSQSDSLIFKVNDKQKNGIHENFQSAFMCINLNKLAEKYKLPIVRNGSDINQINKVIQIIHNFNIKNYPNKTENIKKTNQPNLK